MAGLSHHELFQRDGSPPGLGSGSVQGRRWVADRLASSHTAHPTAAALTFSSPMLLLVALILRLTSSPGSRGHLEEPVGFFLAGGLWATSTTTPGEALMLKKVQPVGAELREAETGRTERHGESGPPQLSAAVFLLPKCPRQRSASLTLTTGGCQEVVRNKTSPLVQRAYPGTRNIAGRCAQQRHTHGCVHRATCTPEACSPQTHTGLCPNKESDRLLLLELWQTSTLKGLPF